MSWELILLLLAFLAVSLMAWCVATGVVWLVEGVAIILGGFWELVRGKGGGGHF